MCSPLSGLYIFRRAFNCKEFNLKHSDEMEAISSAETFGASSRCAA